ncbi:hypothetical protein ScPMuIL_008125, partial [Solemya velum]
MPEYLRKNAKFPNKAPLKHVCSSSAHDTLQIDLVDMQREVVLYNKEKCKFILSVMDIFSRFVWLRAIPSKSADVITKHLSLMFAEFGKPKIVQHDRGREFDGEVRLLRDLGVMNIKSRPYHPQSQGKIERMHKTLKQKIAYDFTYANHCGINWAKQLPEYQCILNNDAKECLAWNTPYEIYYGRDSYNEGQQRSEAKWYHIGNITQHTAASVSNRKLLHRKQYYIPVTKSSQLENLSEDRENMYLYLAGNNKLLTNSDARLTDRDCEVLYKLLCNNLFVTSLDLRYNNITDEGAKFIASLIEETSCLEHINLMFNDIGETGAAVIAKSLHKNETLKSLQITGNKIGNRGGMYFAQMLQINTSLEALDLGDTDMTIEAIIALATVLNQNRSLRVLNMNRPLLFTHQEEHTVHVANMLKVNVSLLELHLQKYELRDFGATRLAENLMDNLSLTHLDLSCNRITRDGAKELAKVLKRNTELKVLDLGYNRLEDDGAIYLAEAIGMYNTKLETLVVSYNNIGGKGLCALADSMKLNSSIAAVFIWGNNLQESACI